MAKEQYSLVRQKLGFHIKLGRRLIAHIYEVGGKWYGWALDVKNKCYGDIKGPFDAEDEAVAYFVKK